MFRLDAAEHFLSAAEHFVSAAEHFVSAAEHFLSAAEHWQAPRNIVRGRGNVPRRAPKRNIFVAWSCYG